MKRPLDPRRIEVVDDQIAEILRKRTPAQRLDMAFAANRTARALVLAGLRHRHLDWTPDQLHREVARRMLGAE